MEDEASALTETGRAPPGSYAYMSPEQLRYPRDVDQRTDVYALGVTLYACLTGGRPKHRDLWKDSPQVPEALKRVVSRCLEDKPEDRYQRAVEVAAELERFLSGRRTIAPSALVGAIALALLAAAAFSGSGPETATAGSPAREASEPSEASRPQTEPAKPRSEPEDEARPVEEEPHAPPLSEPEASHQPADEPELPLAEERPAEPTAEDPPAEDLPAEPTEDPPAEPPPVGDPDPPLPNAQVPSTPAASGSEPLPPKPPPGTEAHALTRFVVSPDGRYLLGLNLRGCFVFYRPPQASRWLLSRRLRREQPTTTVEIGIRDDWAGVCEGRGPARVWHLGGDPRRAERVPLTSGGLEETLTRHAMARYGRRFCKECGGRLEAGTNHRHPKEQQ